MKVEKSASKHLHAFERPYKRQIVSDTKPRNAFHACKLVAKQLNVLIRSKSFQERKVLVNSFVPLNFNYCSRLLMFATPESLTKIENLHKRGLRSMLDNYLSSYKKILKKSGKFSMDVKRKH